MIERDGKNCSEDLLVLPPNLLTCLSVILSGMHFSQIEWLNNKRI